MKHSPEKDPYSILGVSPDASPQEIRNAYLSRTRIIHPDRFDRASQPQDWTKANEMLAELNEAYSTLRNPSSRSQYDELHTTKQPRPSPQPSPREQQTQETPPPFEFDIGEMTPGYAEFGNLPESVQLGLLKRQRNKGGDQFQVKLTSIGKNYFFIVALLCWFAYLFTEVDGSKWTTETLLWYIGITIAIGGFIGLNAVNIWKWTKAELKPYFYITPIYFIRTDYNTVLFRPIWSVKDIAVTHNYVNGSYRNSEVILKFEDYSQPLTLDSKERVEALFKIIQTFKSRLNTAYANRDQGYFLKNDDFRRVPRLARRMTEFPPKAKKMLIYAVSVFVCGAMFGVAVLVNAGLLRRGWVRHSTPTSSVLQNTPDPIPSISRYTPAPVVLSPAPTRVVMPSYPEQPIPASGAVRTWTTAERIAPFEIKAAKGQHHLMKLVNALTEDPVMTIFVRSGTTVEIKVPLGIYEVRYASGEIWYGYEYLFGPETSYSKADKTFSFKIDGDQISGFSITLYKVVNGNLSTSPIRPMDF